MDEWAREQIAALEKRVAALERRLSGEQPATASTPQPQQPDPGVDPEIVALVRQGKGIEAIHTYINRTGADMATAKAEVARIASSLSPKDFA